MDSTAAQAGHQLCLQLEAQLRALQRERNFYDPAVRGLRGQLRSAYEGLLLLDYSFAQAKEVEQALWKAVYYKPIEEFRRRIRKAIEAGQAGVEPLRKVKATFQKFLGEAAAFYRGLAFKLQAAYGDAGFRLPPAEAAALRAENARLAAALAEREAQAVHQGGAIAQLQATIADQAADVRSALDLMAARQAGSASGAVPAALCSDLPGAAALLRGACSYSHLAGDLGGSASGAGALAARWAPGVCPGAGGRGASRPGSPERSHYDGLAKAAAMPLLLQHSMASLAPCQQYTARADACGAGASWRQGDALRQDMAALDAEISQLEASMRAASRQL